MSVDSLILCLKALFEPCAAEGFRATVTLRLGVDQFRVQIAGGELEVARGQAERPDLTLESDPGTLSALLRNDLQLSAPLRTGTARLDGDPATAERFLRLFPLPEPAGAP